MWWLTFMRHACGRRSSFDLHDEFGFVSFLLLLLQPLLLLCLILFFLSSFSGFITLVLRLWMSGWNASCVFLFSIMLWMKLYLTSKNYYYSTYTLLHITQYSNQAAILLFLTLSWDKVVMLLIQIFLWYFNKLLI